MEWVETTGKTVEDAKEAALDQLGVDESDAEFQILEEPRAGLFGRMRSEARVRARVMPTTPRPKQERRPRTRRTGRSKATEDTTVVDSPAGAGDDGSAEEPDATAGNGGNGGTETDDQRGPRGPREKETQVGEALTLEAQAELAKDFLLGIADRFGVDADASIRSIDEDTIEVALTGQDLGLLVGPKGTTLQALQELARTVVQRHTTTRTGRLLVDVAGYRQKRKEALEKFTRSVAEDVLASGRQKVLEPMNPADRKIIHDTVNLIDGVCTTSEGEEPRRRVVIMPEAE